jgi:hypothetical protein
MIKQIKNLLFQMLLHGLVHLWVTNDHGMRLIVWAIRVPTSAFTTCESQAKSVLLTLDLSPFYFVPLSRIPPKRGFRELSKAPSFSKFDLQTTKELNIAENQVIGATAVLCSLS